MKNIIGNKIRWRESYVPERTVGVHSGKKNFEKRPEIGMGVVMSPTHTHTHTSTHTYCIFTLEKWFLNCHIRKVDLRS